MPVYRLFAEDVIKLLKAIGEPMQELAEKYAALKGTTVIKSYLNDDGAITFILESGPKMTMSAELLRDAIAAMQPDEPFYLMEETPADKPKSKAKGRTKK